MILFLAVAGATAAAAWVLTPMCGRLARRLGVVDTPDVRKVHKEPIPYFGGVAVFMALVVGLGVSLLLAKDAAATIGRADASIYTIVAGATLMFLTGLADDIKHLRARHKLLLQLLAAFAVCASGARIETLHITESLTIDFGAFAWPLTILWIVGITNALNLIDGLDGLATGIGAIACAAIGYVALGHLGEGEFTAQIALLFGIFGALLGFLPHNHRPAKIFLGDAGSLLIGFLLATLSIASSAKSAAFATVAVPSVALIALGVPVFDTLFAMLRRLIERRGLMSPDRNHIHHRLLQRGLSHRNTVYVLWAETAAMTVLAVALVELDVGNLMRAVIFGVVVLLHMVFFRQMGSVRLRESYRAMKEAAARMAIAGAQKREFDELDLQFERVETTDEWWGAVTMAAERMGFARVTVDHRLPNGGALFNRAWEVADRQSGESLVRARVPVRTSSEVLPAELEVEVPSESLESAGSRITLFGRLIDRHGLDGVSLERPTAPAPATPALSASPA